MRRGWQRAFDISISTFIITGIIAITAIITNWLVPDEIFYGPAYSSKYVGVQALIAFIKVIDTADFYATILSGIASGFTFLMKAMH